MKTVFVCAVCVLVLCCVDQSDARDFLENIGHAFSVAWKSVVDQIKRPVQVRRIGPSSKLKKASTSVKPTVSPTTTASVNATDKARIQTAISLKPDHVVPTMKYERHKKSSRLLLPYLTTPDSMNPVNWIKNDRYPTKNKLQDRGTTLNSELDSESDSNSISAASKENTLRPKVT